MNEETNFDDYNASQITPQYTLLEKFNKVIDWLKGTRKGEKLVKTVEKVDKSLLVAYTDNTLQEIPIGVPKYTHLITFRYQSIGIALPNPFFTCEFVDTRALPYTENDLIRIFEFSKIGSVYDDVAQMYFTAIASKSSSNSFIITISDNGGVSAAFNRDFIGNGNAVTFFSDVVA